MCRSGAAGTSASGSNRRQAMRRPRASRRPGDGRTRSLGASDRARPDKAHVEQRNTGRVMSEESTTPDLVELMRRRVDAADSGDVEAITSFFASDAVWDSSPMGMEVFEGREAIRRFFADWWGLYDMSGAEPRRFLISGTESLLRCSH